MVADTAISKQVDIKIWRNGKTRTLTVEVGDLEAYEEVEQADSKAPPKATENTLVIEDLGIKLAPLSDALRRGNQLPDNAEGVFVADIKKDSPAQKAGLMPGEVIVEIDRQKAGDPQNAARLLAASNKIKLLLVQRGNQLRFTTIQTAE